MELWVRGSMVEGFWVEFGHGEPLLHHGSSEFSAVFSRADSSRVTETVPNWRATSAESLQGEVVHLSGYLHLRTLGARVAVSVIYRLRDHILTKEITFTSDTELRYRLVNRMESKVRAEQFWTFEQENSEGGPIYEVLPAMGLRVKGRVYALLTDNGYRNRWTRICRQTDGLGQLVGLEKQPDAELACMSTPEEQGRGIHFVQFKFGEYIDYEEACPKDVVFSSPSSWTPLHETVAIRVVDEENGGTLRGTFTQGRESGVGAPVVIEKNELYEISFRYKSTHPLSLRLLDSTNGSYFDWGKELGAYRDGIDATPAGWRSYATRFSSARCRNLHQPAELKIMVDGQSGDEYMLSVADLEFRRLDGVVKEFHTLEAGVPASIRLFIAETGETSHRKIQIACQVSLATALGFEGSEAEKILFANNQMLIWIAQHDKAVPHVVPSLNYHPDMYLRDTFWQVHAVPDKEVSESCWNRFAQGQHEDGQLDTLVRAYRYAPSRDDNDSTMWFIIWAYTNWRQFGTTVNLDPITNAFNHLRKTHCPRTNGKYLSRTAGWLDTVWRDVRETEGFAINQGHFAVTLQCAKELGLAVSTEEIEEAKQAYRDFYDEDKGYVVWSDSDDFRSPSVLLGEFLNLWLFDEPILLDHHVIDTLDRLPVMNRGVPCIVDGNGQFFSNDFKPWEAKYNWPPGVYHNGGSWFLYEYLAYVAGARHSWAKATDLMEWRLTMEFSKDDEPYSHEFIPLSDNADDWWPTCRVFGWNTFAIVANRVANCTHAWGNHSTPKENQR